MYKPFNVWDTEEEVKYSIWDLLKEDKRAESEFNIKSISCSNSIISDITDTGLFKVLEDMGKQSEYWSTCYKFVLSIKDRYPDTLTPKQLDWLFEIKAGLNIESWKREAKIAWEGIDIKATQRAYNMLFSSNAMEKSFSSE